MPPQAYVQGPIVINGSGGVTLKVMSEKSHDYGQQAMTSFASHRPYPSFAAIKSAEPMIPIKTTDLKAFLTVCNLLSGYAVQGSNTLDSFMVAVQDGGVRASGSVHHRTRISRGLLYAKNMSGSRNEPVTADAELCVTYDGSSAPFLEANNMALPANVYVIEQYVLSKLVLGGVTYDDVQSFSLELNPEVRKIGGSDDVYPSAAYLLRVNPRFTFTCLDVRRSAVYGANGSAVADGAFFLRRMKNGSDRFADSDAVHIRFAFANTNVMAYPSQVTGPDQNESNVTIQVQPIEVSTGSTLPFSTSVDVVIS
jgi:hypothetical protein